MAPIRLVWPLRSDGTGERPPTSKLQKVTDKNGTERWLEEVGKDEAKHRDWRKKLGLMTMIEQEKLCSEEERQKLKADSEEGMIYMLHDFPEGYTLYEQHTIKPSAKEGGQAEERRDAYLYGHPGGEKKRFRTPKEFFEHLFWLLTDESLDPNNCTCPRCVPEDLHKEVEELISGKPTQTQTSSSKQKPAKPEQTDQAVSTNPVSAPALASVPAPAPASTPAAPAPAPAPTPVPVRSAPPASLASVEKTVSARASPSMASSTSASIQTRPTQPRPASSGRSAPKSHLQPSQLPEILSQEQAEDAQPGSYVYRIGEVVWFSKGQAWGLGILADRATKTSGSVQQLTYTVQPLSYPGANCELVAIQHEQQLKPWYAYSPPNLTHERLNAPDVINHAFNEIPWQQVVSGSLGAGDAEVDASIYAAKTVDRSYCPIQPLTPSAPGTRAAYNGIFIGAEKVWRGDAVRLKPPPTANPALSNPEILIVTDIVEAIPPSGPLGPDRLAPRDSVILIGDRYVYAQIPIKIPDREPDPTAYLSSRIPTRIPTLPNRVAEDLIAQNRFSVTRHVTANSWRLVATKQSVAVTEVQGRWYESLRLLPIINPELYQHALNTGQIPDVGRSLNMRGDSPLLADGSPGFRFNHREAVLGGSVPPMFNLPKVQPVAGRWET